MLPTQDEVKHPNSKLRGRNLDYQPICFSSLYNVFSSVVFRNNSPFLSRSRKLFDLKLECGMID